MKTTSSETRTTQHTGLTKTPYHGPYSCQILLLAGSKEELFEKRGSKRVPRTVINTSDVEVEEENIDFQLPAAHSRQTLKQAITNKDKKMKLVRQEEWQRREPYDEVIKERNELRQIAATMTEKMNAKLSASTTSEWEGSEVDEGPSRDVNAHTLHSEPSSTPLEPIDKEIMAAKTGSWFRGSARR
ncbi:hypothetical protein HPB50_008170 [Hyalomma asiaticum]|uniref:Uncharacterized protein n=1 Tax=Hyalomma asiaticum TaxID=266040 RepID=A0ACB7TKK6_HYAAI|nr:hypothetical protein HPB50_008170 [Hyalomma asiaticum]